MIERYAVRSVTAVLYAMGCAFVFLGVVLAVALFENNRWLSELTGLYYVGNLVAAVALLSIGTLVFGLLEWIIVRLEQLRAPTLLDHLRHSALLYMGLAFSGFILFVTYESQAGGLGYGLGVGLVVIGVYAASIDAAMLLLRRRLNRFGHGGAR